MREFIEIIDNLAESTGITGRRTGDVFKNATTGEEIVFQNTYQFPEAGGQYESEAARNQAIADFAKSVKIESNQIHWVNNGKNMGGFIIAEFQSNSGPLYFGRFFKNINAAKTSNKWENRDIPGFQFQGASSVKEESGYQPSVVFAGRDANNLSPAQVAGQIINHFGKTSYEAQAVQTFMSSDFPMTFTRGNMNPVAFRDYFCEMLQPMALVLGKSVAGNAADCAQEFFGQPSFEGCVISFGGSVSEGLYDSLISTSSGQTIKLSTKGGKSGGGAQASATNLLDSVAALESTEKGKKLVSQYDSVIAVLNIIADSSAEAGPVNLAMLPNIGIITTEDRAVIAQMNQLPVGTRELTFGSDTLRQLYATADPVPQDWSKVIPKQRMITVLAYEVAKKINSMPEFSKAATDILNYGALIQMYSSVKETQDTIILQGFKAVYPSQAVSGAILGCKAYGNNYKPKGKFTFKIKSN